MHNLSKYVMLLVGISLAACSRLVEVPEPLDSITTSGTFSTEPKANSAIAGIYKDMTMSGMLAGGFSPYGGMSADELEQFGYQNPFQTNTLTPIDGNADPFWIKTYFNIYQANAAIEGLAASTTLSSEVKHRLDGEAKFLRAYNFFYLVNLFGDAPLTLSSSYKINSLLARTGSAIVYGQIISDLKEAQLELPADFSAGGGERIRANSWAATALLARTYLYTKKWDSAETEASKVINNGGQYTLVTDLDSAFLRNNTEAILQFRQSFNGGFNSAGTIEGWYFIPASAGQPPIFYMTAAQVAAFEPDDLRRSHWVDSTLFDDGVTITTYYYPFKYKIQTTADENVNEYELVLRLAEQFLIRAEARAQQNNLEGAIEDLNIIRGRAGLPPLPSTLSQQEVITAVAQENRVEFFAEMGHRWLDLKRTDQADAILVPLKPFWKPTAVLYPVPYSEIQTNPNLVQNPGYIF